MRSTILALTVMFVAPTTVMASMADRELVGSSGVKVAGAIQIKVASDGVDHAERNVILAKGDKSGTGPGHGGHKGAKKGEHKGGQAKGEERGGPKPREDKGGPKPR